MILLFGAPDASGLSIGSATLMAGAKSGNGGAIDALIDLALDGAKLVIKPGPDDANSFLASLLPAGRAHGELLALAALFERDRLPPRRLGRARGEFPVQIQLGPIELQSVTLALRPQGNAITMSRRARRSPPSSARCRGWSRMSG